jgi:hypothetical protein
MRTNRIGDKYCHTVAEANGVIEDNENGWNVYCCEFSPPEDMIKATAEIRDNETGELVCYLEAADFDAIKAMAKELRIEVQE